MLLSSEMVHLHRRHGHGLTWSRGLPDQQSGHESYGKLHRGSSFDFRDSRENKFNRDFTEHQSLLLHPMELV